MTSWEMARIFNETADFLEILAENPYKIRAYRKAARVIGNFPPDLENLVRDKRLQVIPGIGSNLAAKIEEMAETGCLSYYEELKKRISPVYLKLLRIPGIGVKTVKILYRNLPVTSVEELEEAAKNKQLQKISGVGEKTELAILEGIASLNQRLERWHLDNAAFIAEIVDNYLKKLDFTKQISVAGSFRRGQETVTGLDFVVGSEEPLDVIRAFIKAPWVKEIVSAGEAKAAVLTKWGMQIDLLVVQPPSFPSALVYLTGSVAHNARLQNCAREKGRSVSEYGILQGDKFYTPHSEEDFYHELGLSLIPPELREDQGEFEAAQENRIPELLQVGDIKGDLHMHTTWSDGMYTLNEMVMAAKEKEYDYIAITDHSKSLVISNGLSEERLLQQQQMIKQLNSETEGITILSGTEVDILSNKELDFDDRVLADLDVVVASIHSGFKQSKELLTERLLAAIDNKNVDIIGHPTGRLLSRRDPYPLDIERVLEAAEKHGTAMEINASTDRLDLKDAYIRKGKELGVVFAINTDAHHVNSLDDMQYGVKTARRGWLEKNDVINTFDLKKLKAWLKHR